MIDIGFIEQKIEQLISEFKQFPEKFLTEEDIRCYLYSILLERFGSIQNCEDNNKSIPLHTEVRWYGNSGKLKLRSDIVVIDASSLRTTEKYFKLPSKGYTFNKPKIILEIKLRRKNGKSDNGFKSAIQRDRNKLLDLRKEIKENFTSFLLVFDKKNNMNLALTNQQKHKEYYTYPYTQGD